MMRLQTIAMAAGLAGMLAVTASAPAKADEQQGLVDKARITLESFANDKQMGPFREQLKKAKGVFVVPQLLKAGFIIGGSGGSGVLLGRDSKAGEWTQPAFYTMGAGSVGFQIGAEAAEVVLLLMNEKGLNAVLSTNLKLGADVSIAAGPLGQGVAAGTTTNLRADVLAFSRTKGLFAGAALEGAVIANRDEWNKNYYGRPVTATDIIVRRNVSNPGSDGLRSILARAAGT